MKGLFVADSKTEKIRQAARAFGLVTPVGREAASRAPEADEHWELPGGSARVY